jgi:hypothetical protein
MRLRAFTGAAFNEAVCCILTACTPQNIARTKVCTLVCYWLSAGSFVQKLASARVKFSEPARWNLFFIDQSVVRV